MFAISVSFAFVHFSLSSELRQTSSSPSPVSVACNCAASMSRQMAASERSSVIIEQEEETDVAGAIDGNRDTDDAATPVAVAHTTNAPPMTLLDHRVLPMTTTSALPQPLMPAPAAEEKAALAMAAQTSATAPRVKRRLLAAIAGWLSEVRVSPAGDWLAFIDHPVERFDDYGIVMVVDLKGNNRKLSKAYASARGLAWSPAGDEVWFTAAENTLNHGLHAVSLQGKERLLARAPGRLNLQDISKDGRLLVTREDGRIGMMALAPCDAAERDWSWLDGSWLRDISPDGRTLLFDEENTASDKTPTVYVRRTDGLPAVKLGDGNAVSLSPDGRWALADQRYTSPPRFVLLPTGAGEMKTIDSGEIEWRETGMWFADSRRVVLMGKEPGHKRRSYVYDLEHNELRPLTSEGTVVMLLAPDGKHMLVGEVGSNNQKVEVRSFEGGESRPFTALKSQDTPISWSADNQAIFTVQRGMPVKVFRINLMTGRRELWKELMHPDPAGLLYLHAPSLTPDA